MTPLNRAERDNAFVAFLILFSITIGIIIIVVFFSIKVPFQENERLRNRLLVMQNEENVADSFKVAMNVVLNELTKFDLKKEPAIVTMRSVQIKIDKMGKLIKKMPERSNEEKSIYELVMQNLADLNDAKLKIRNLEDGKN